MPDVLQQVKVLDPAPAHSELPTGIWPAVVVLQELDGRIGTMQTHEEQIERVVLAPRGPRWRPLWTLAAAFAAVLAAGAVIMAFPGGDDVAEVTTEAPTTTAATTSVAPAVSALALVQEFHDLWDAADVAGYQALLSPTSQLSTQGSRGIEATDSRYALATGMVVSRQCKLMTPQQVRCEIESISGLQPGVVLDAGSTVYTVTDGEIVDRQLPDSIAAYPNLESAALSSYLAWVRDTEPEAFDELFAFGTTMILNTDEAIAGHQEMVAKYLAANGRG